MTGIFEKDMQKTLKEELRSAAMTAYSRAGHDDGSGMADYVVKKTDVVVKFSNGMLLSVEKPDIKTSFCFDDSFDYDGAVSMVETATRSAKYFKDVNMSDYDDEVERADSGKLFLRTVKEGAYALLTGGRWYETSDDVRRSYKAADVFELVGADRDLYFEACKIVREHLEKRVDAYLKRYGTSKVRAWHYWGMA